MKVWDSVLCLQTAAGDAGRQVPLWASLGICPSLSRNVWVYLMWQRAIWGRNMKRCDPGLQTKPADSLSTSPHFSHSSNLSLSRLLIPPISLAFSYCLGRDFPVRRKGCCLLYLRSTMRTILFKSTMPVLPNRWVTIYLMEMSHSRRHKAKPLLLSTFAKLSAHFIQEKQARSIWIPEHPWHSWRMPTLFFPIWNEYLKQDSKSHAWRSVRKCSSRSK